MEYVEALIPVARAHNKVVPEPSAHQGKVRKGHYWLNFASYSPPLPVTYAAPAPAANVTPDSQRSRTARM